MRTVDHKLLGIYLMKKAALHHKISMLDKVAFLWGNVEPDINCFTHLKGFLQHRTFRGHHFQSCCIRIQILLKRINEDDFNVTKYYRMGKLTHYIADSFTFPHNEFFSGDIMQHMSYEHVLHFKLVSFLNLPPGADCSFVQKVNDWTLFVRRHNQYIRSRGNALDDIKYIIGVTSQSLLGVIGQE